MSVVLCVLLPLMSLDAQSGGARRVMRGDTTVVSVPVTGRWGAERAATEVALVVGARDGEPFGRVTALATLPDGGVVVFDAMGPNGAVAWVLDANGRLERQLGRDGSGPGEYRACFDCLASNVDGSIGFLDNANRRITTYERRGTVRSTTALPADVGFGAPPQFLPGPAGSYYARVAISPRSRTPITDAQEYERYGYVHITERGKVLDTLPAPKSWFASPARWLFEPRTIWRPMRDGRVAVGGTDRLRIMLNSQQTVTRPFMIEGTSSRIPFSQEERGMWRAVAGHANKYHRAPPSLQAPLPGDVPQLKPVFKDIETDHVGRLYLRLHAPAVRAPAEMLPEAVAIVGHAGRIPPAPQLDYLEPPVFAVFESDGIYLGQLRFPVNATSISFGDGVAWALRKDTDGQDVLVKYYLPNAGAR
jgi:hypothetical protein